MTVGRPYSGMELDVMEERLRSASQECLNELSLIADELEHRNTRSARSLQQRVIELRKYLELFVKHNGG